MAEIGRWNGHIFEASSSVVRGISDLTVKGSSETEEKTTDGQKYTSMKNSNPIEVSLTVKLSAYLGCDVRDESDAFLADVNSGAKDYLYIGGSKLVTCQLMLTSANVDEVAISPSGQWLYCAVALTLKQCSNRDGTIPSSSSGSSGENVSSSNTSSKKTSVKASSYIGSGSSTTEDATTSTSETSLFKNAVSYIQSTVTASAKAASKSKVTLTTVNLLKLLK